MRIRPAAPMICCAALLASAVGCRSVHQCCTSLFASRESTLADITPVPEKSDAVRTVVHSDEIPLDKTRADSESASAHRRFNIPEELPGSAAAPLVMPPMDPTQSIEERRSLADALFPSIIPAEVHGGPDANALPLTLTAMQQMAVENSPVIRQAAADVEQARGRAVQAGLYPNPTVGYEGDTLGTARTAGYNGVFFTQEFVTAGKLTLAQSVAMNEMRAAQADLRKARITLASNVRRNFFKVLISQEQLKFNRAIAKLSNEVYRAQIDLVSGGEAAPYEPLQLRVFAVQARNTVTQSANSLEASWRQLAAAMGMPHLTRQHVAGSVDVPVPAIDYNTLVSMLQRHSDLIAANSRIASSSSNLRLQEAVPVPNVTLYAAFQHDDTTPLSDYSTNVQLSAPVPVFNRNQGNITSAHAGLVRARQDLNGVNNTLMSDLAETYNRYSTSRTISESYRTDLLPDQVRVYRGVYDRFLIDGESIDFAQIVVAQQTLAQVVTGYLQSLTESWMAVVDLAELMQIDDLMTMDGVATVSDVAADDAPGSTMELGLPRRHSVAAALTEPSAFAAEPSRPDEPFTELTSQENGEQAAEDATTEATGAAQQADTFADAPEPQIDSSVLRSPVLSHEEDTETGPGNSQKTSASKIRSRRPTPKMIEP